MENTKQIIDNTIRALKISNLDITFNELASMYTDGELIIQPEYLRTFRWDIGKQSRFIESLLLEMPIPPICVIEFEDGSYELIDGLQRISSYLSFRGLLKTDNPEDDDVVDCDDSFEFQDYDVIDADEIKLSNGFALEGCDVIPELNGMTYLDLQASLQIKLKRSFILLQVLRRGVNPEMKYHMFRRLNTGSEQLSAQEMRNCTIRLIDDKFINFIKELKTDKHFRNTISRIGSTRIKRRFDEELVLRFFAFKNSRETFTINVDEFLTSYMESVARSSTFNYELERMIFQNTFKYLDEAYGKTVFCMFNEKKNTYGVFNAYLYEAISVGMQDFLEKAVGDQSKYKAFCEAMTSLKSDKDFRAATVGGGKNSPTPMNTRIEKVREMMKGLYS